MGTDLIVLSYPRSGSTWLARLLGDCFQAPIKGLAHEQPLAAERRPENGVSVYQTHRFDLLPENGVIIHITRDPRDIIVSAKHYWETSLETAVACILHGGIPIFPLGWAEFIHRARSVAHHSLHYADLHTRPLNELLEICGKTGLDPKTDLKTTIARQAFDQALKHARPEYYGPVIQRKALRKGVSGDWMNFLSPLQVEEVIAALGPEMRQEGFL